MASRQRKWRERQDNDDGDGVNDDGDGVNYIINPPPWRTLEQRESERRERAMAQINSTIKHSIRERERARRFGGDNATARNKDDNKERARVSERWRRDNAKRNN